MVPTLKVIGIDPGDTTGCAYLVVPIGCVFGRMEPRVIESEFLEFVGTDCEQALEIAAYAREKQGLDYQVGPALSVEAWDQDPRFKSTDPAALIPVRIGAQLKLLRHMSAHTSHGVQVGYLGDSTLTFQSRTLAKETYTDDRLEAVGMYVPGSDHIRDATRQALTLLRRARKSLTFAQALWPAARYEGQG